MPRGMLDAFFGYSGFAAADAVWGALAVRRIGRLKPTRASRWGKWAILGFAALQSIYALRFAANVMRANLPDVWPMPLHVLAYVWHLGVLPIALGALLAVEVAGWRKRRLSSKGPLTLSPGAPELSQHAISRRMWLGATVATLPPAATLIGSAAATFQLHHFRIAKLDLPVPNLPDDLAGLTIAHVSDLHIGKFLPRDTPARVADAVNAMEPDLVLFTGDLIDLELTDLPAGVDFLRRLCPRHGLAVVEGNHDTMVEAGRFEGALRDAGLPLLLDETMTFALPNRPTPVQLLGITWGKLQTGRQMGRYWWEANRLYRTREEEDTVASVNRVAAMRDPRAFPIVLAHHPHAFDTAAALSLPLVLSGHTHGGQLMLNERCGVGPIRFRYWSGLYRKPGSHLFVNNGIGNWFPVRINAPAEIVHLTLRKA